MKTFAEMSEAERRYEVCQLLAEARECGHDIGIVCHVIGLMFVKGGLPVPVSLWGWLMQPEATVH